MKIIDAHIHLDRYEDKEIESMLKRAHWLEALVSVSFNLHSCKRNLKGKTSLWISSRTAAAK